MARIASRMTLRLGLAFAMALAGCEKKAVEQKKTCRRWLRRDWQEVENDGGGCLPAAPVS